MSEKATQNMNQLLQVVGTMTDQLKVVQKDIKTRDEAFETLQKQVATLQETVQAMQQQQQKQKQQEQKLEEEDDGLSTAASDSGSESADETNDGRSKKKTRDRGATRVRRVMKRMLIERNVLNLENPAANKAWEQVKQDGELCDEIIKEALESTQYQGTLNGLVLLKAAYKNARKTVSRRADHARLETYKERNRKSNVSRKERKRAAKAAKAVNAAKAASESTGSAPGDDVEMTKTDEPVRARQTEKENPQPSQPPSESSESSLQVHADAHNSTGGPAEMTSTPLPKRHRDTGQDADHADNTPKEAPRQKKLRQEKKTLPKADVLKWLDTASFVPVKGLADPTILKETVRELWPEDDEEDFAVDTFGRVYARDLETLVGTAWITAPIIDCLLEDNNDPSTSILSLAESRELKNFVEKGALFDRHLGIKDPSQIQRLLVPLHVNSNHFVLVTVEDDEVELYDGLQRTNCVSRMTPDMEKAVAYFKQLTGRYHVQPKPIVRNTPRQTDVVNCGVHLVLKAYRKLGLWPQWQSKHCQYARLSFVAVLLKAGRILQEEEEED